MYTVLQKAMVFLHFPLLVPIFDLTCTLYLYTVHMITCTSMILRVCVLLLYKYACAHTHLGIYMRHA